MHAREDHTLQKTWPRSGYRGSKRERCHCIAKPTSMVLLDANRSISHDRSWLSIAFWCQVSKAVKIILKIFSVVDFEALETYHFDQVLIWRLEWLFLVIWAAFGWPVRWICLENTVYDVDINSRLRSGWIGWAGWVCFFGVAFISFICK